MGRERIMQLRETGQWVPAAEGKEKALFVYGEFYHNWDHAEALIRLSYAVRQGFEAHTKLVLPDAMVESLVDKDYFNRAIGSASSRLTLKGLVAANLVVPDVECDDISSIGGWAQEPFANYELLPKYAATFAQNRETKRQEAIRDFA